jgi:plastocyanin
LAAEDTRLSHRPRHLSLHLAAIGAGTALALAVASADAGAPPTASITAKDPYSFDNGGGASSVTIARGGTVSFSYPKGSSLHNVRFDTQPTSCSGMPALPAGPGWSGSCRFDSPGTYSFYCGQHYFMTGKVEVVDPNAPPTGTTGPPGGVVGPPSVKVARRQVGTVIRGTVTTPGGPSKIAVTAFARKRAVAARAKRVKVGSVRKTSKGTGSTAFRLPVNRAARKAIHRRHRLALTIRIAVTPPDGYPTTRSMAVVLRAKS